MKQKIHYLFMLLLMLVAGTGGVKAQNYELVTDASTLVPGDKVVIGIITDDSGTKKAWVAGNIESQFLTRITGSTLQGNTITTLKEGTIVFTLGENNGNWTFANSEGQLLGATAAKNMAWGSGTTTWTISVADGNATIASTNSNFGRILYNVNSPRFLNYTSNTTASMLLVQLFKKVESGPSAEATTLTIDASGITNTDVYQGTAAGSLSATVKDASNNAVSDATVTWSGNNDNVATIDASTGAVTLVAAGTVTFTASYAGVAGEYQASSATYEMTVTSSAPYVQPTTIEANLNNDFFNCKAFTSWSDSYGTTFSGNKDNVTITLAKGESKYMYINTGAIRMYDGNTLTFTAPQGYNITKIVLAGADGFDANLTAEGLSDRTWTGEASEVVIAGNSNKKNITAATITLAKPSSVKVPTFSLASGNYFEAQSVTLSCETEGATIKYSYDEETWKDYTTALQVSSTTTIYAKAILGTDESSVVSATYTFPTVLTTIAAVKALDNNTETYVNLTGAQVVYIDEAKKYIYVKDESGAICLYNNSGFTTDLKAGDILSGIIEGKYNPFNNLPEITNISNIGELKATGTEDVVSVVISPEKIADHLCQLVTFAKTDISNNNNKYYADGNVQLYDSFYKFGELEDGVYKVSGVALVYNDQYEIAPRAKDDISKIPVVAAIGTKKYETLEAAFAAVQDDETITLLDDVTLADKLVVALGGKAVTLDLGEKTLTGRTNLTSGNLTVTNGTIVGGSQQALNVYGSATNAENYSVLTIADNVTVTADVYGVSMFGATAGGDGYGAVVNIAGKVTTTGDNKNGAVFVSGNLGHGIANDMNNVINVTGSITSATDAAIALNGNATVNVKSGAEITGNTGIAVKRGVLNVEEDATVHATGEANLTPGANNNGTEMTGAAISMTDTYNNYGAMAVNITGGTFTSDNTDALFKEDGTYTNAATYSVSGGTFNSAVPAEFCAPGYEPKDLGNGQYSVYAPTYEIAIKSVTPKADSWYISGTPNIQFTITKDGQVLSNKQLNQEQLEKWDIILDENYLTLKSKAAFAKWLQYNFNVVGAGTTTIVFQNKANPSIKVEQEVTISHKLTLTIQPAGTHMVEAGPVEIATNTKFDGVAIENFEDYTFTSSDESIATISGTTITPLKAGTITVTATKNDDQTASASANVTFIDAPAKIGDVYYESIGKAMEAAQSGETITLLRDVTESYPFTGNQPRTNDFALTIDLNGHTWNGTSDKPYVLRVDYGTITIKDSQSGGGVKYGSDYAFIVSHLASEYPSKLILENGTFTGKTSVAQVGNPGGSGSNKKYYGGDLVVNGGTFVTVPDEGETYDENGNFKYTLNKLDMVESSYPGGIYSPSTITVNGGKFLKFDPQNNLAEGANTNFVPEGLVSTKSVESGEAWYTISKIVAKIDETTYASLADAFTAATNGQTITVLTDIDLPSTIAVTKQVTLDLNGKTISNTSALWVGKNWSFFSVQANGNLTVTGDGTIDAKENDCYTFDVRDGGVLTIKDGTFTGNISCVYLYNKENIGVSTCNIEGGTFSIKQLADEQGDRYRFLLNCYDASYKNNTVKFNVTGGSFVNFNPANNQAEGAATNFCAAGYEAVQDGNVWTVQQIQLSAPIIFHDSGEYEGELQIAMAGEGTIMYTLNDGEAQTYSAPFTIRDEGEYIIKAWAVKDGVASDVTEPKTFTIKKKAKSAVVEDGYYTIQTNDDKYVNVAGRKTVTLVSDTKSAGTVIRVKADEDGVKVLRSQAVDLPRYAERAMSYVPEIVKEVVKKLAANVDDPIIGEQGADLILDKFNKEFDYHLYLEGENNTYRIYGRTPSMKPVVDFYAENKELIDGRLLKVEGFVKEVLQKVVDKVGRGQSVVDMFKVKTIWQNMGGTLTEPTDDASTLKFYEEVLSSETNVWNFAYQTGMLYWEKVKGYLTENAGSLGDYGKYLEKIPNVRPNFKYYIVPGENGVDIISEGNSQITDASTAWTLTKRTGFDVTFDATLSKNNGKEMYKTLYVDFGYKLPDGVTALKVTAIDENTGVAKTEEIGQEVAPQTPVLLKSDKAGDITLTIGDNFGSAVTDNQLVGADYLINKYEINTPQVESIFTLLANLSKSLANEYSYLKRKNAGTVNNKYFFGLTKDDLKLCYYLNDNEEKDCVVRSLSMGDEKLGFYNNWTAKANEAFLVSEQFNPVKLTLKGDVNRDGSITIADVTALVNIILGKATYPADADKYDFEAAHVNADEDITIADVTALVNIILGK